MKKLFNFRPVLFCGIFACLGVGFAFSVYFSYVFWAIIILTSAILSCGLFMVFSKEKLKINIVFTVIFLALFGIFALNMNFTLNNFLSENYGDHYLTVTGRVTDSEAEAGGGGVILKDVTLSGRKSDYKMRLSVYGVNTLKVGDEITFYGYVYANSLKYEGRFSANNVTERIRYYANIDISEISVKGNSLSLLETVKVFIGDTLKKGMTGDNYGVSYALLTGDSGLMDDDVLQSFRDSGVAHIFAVSGLHVGFLAAVLSFIFRKLKINGIVSAVIIIFAVFFYCGACGFSASCLRAGIMFSVLSCARLFGKRYDGLSALGLAALIVLFIFPAQLFRSGFQLSFSVVFGILALSGTLKRGLKKFPDKISSAISTSVSAFLFGAPICMYAFGNVSFISVLVNLLLIPVVGVVFILLFSGVLLGALTTLFTAALFIPDVIIKGVVFIMQSVNFSALLYGGILITGVVVFYYLALITVSGLINVRGRIKVITVCVLSSVFVLGTVIFTVRENSFYKVSLIGDEKICAAVIKSEDEYFMVISDVTSDNFSTGRISRAVRQLDADNVNIIIPMMERKPDVFNITEKISDIVTVKSVYFAFSMTYYEKTAFIETFDNIDLYLIGKGENIKSVCDIYLSQDAFGVKITGKSGGVYLLSSYPSEKTPYENLNLSDCDIIAVTTAEETVSSRYPEITVLSYRGHGKFENAGKNGNYTYKFN